VAQEERRNKPRKQLNPFLALEREIFLVKIKEPFFRVYLIDLKGPIM